MNEPNEPRIYLLPNLMTAGNLFCGFAAVLKIIDGSLLAAAGQSVGSHYHEAIAFIFSDCPVRRHFLRSGHLQANPMGDRLHVK